MASESELEPGIASTSSPGHNFQLQFNNGI